MTIENKTNIELEEHLELKAPTLGKDDYIQMLEEFSNRIDSLPSEARYSFVNHAELVAILRTIIDIFRS